MKTSKTPSTPRKSPPGRAPTATSSRSSTRKPAKAAARASTKKPAKAEAGAKRVVRMVKKVAPPKSDLTRVHDLLGRFSTVMLVTTEGEGEKAGLHVRPMDVAKLDDDCTLSFVTGLDHAASYESKPDAPAYVVAQGRSVFVSLRGRVEVVRDRERIHAAWKPADKVYFPEGKDDPNLCLAVLHPEEVEYWDMTGPKGIRYLFEAAKALFSGEAAKPSEGSEMHDRIELGDWSARA